MINKLNWKPDSSGEYAISDIRQYRLESTFDKGIRAEVCFLGKHHSYTAGWHPTIAIAKKVCELHEAYYVERGEYEG